MENYYRGIIIYKEGKKTRKKTIQGNPTLWGAFQELVKAGMLNNEKVQRAYILHIPSNNLVWELVK